MKVPVLPTPALQWTITEVPGILTLLYSTSSWRSSSTLVSLRTSLSVQPSQCRWSRVFISPKFLEAFLYNQLHTTLSSFTIEWKFDKSFGEAWLVSNGSISQEPHCDPILQFHLFPARLWPVPVSLLSALLLQPGDHHWGSGNVQIKNLMFITHQWHRHPAPTPVARTQQT